MKVVVYEIPDNCKECLFVRKQDRGLWLCSLLDVILNYDFDKKRDFDCPLKDIDSIVE